jgi:NADH-quinone oxidoreductase subunit C
MAGSFLDLVRTAASDFDADFVTDSRGGLRVSVSAERALGLLTRLREEPESSMRRLVDLTAIDLEGKPRRFEVVYWLRSPGLNESLRVHVGLDESSLVVDSVVEQWPNANWLEREVFDLFGIGFRAHPDLRRILLDQDFEGAPLRKDYPRQPNLELPKAAKA